MDTDPRHTDERNRVDHARMETVPKLVSNDEETRQTNDPRSRGNLPSGIPGKRGWYTRGRKQLSGCKPDAFEDSLRTPVPKGTEGAPTVAKRNLEVPAQRSDTEELLWELYDLSRCCPSGPRRKATKNAERRGRNEGEEEKETRSTKIGSTYDLGNISHEQFGQTVEPLLVEKISPASPWVGALQSLVGAHRSSGRSPAGGALRVETVVPAFPQRRWYAHQWPNSHRTPRTRRDTCRESRFLGRCPLSTWC